MRYFNDILTARLQYLADNINIEQHLDERFSQVYPTFDPNVHFTGMADDDIPKDAPLDSPVIVGPNAPVLFPSIGYIPDDDHDESSPDSSSTHSALADGHVEDTAAPTEDPDDSFDEITLSTLAGEDEYGEGWGESSDLPVFDGSAIALVDASTFAPTGEPPMYAAPDAPPVYVGPEAPPVYVGPEAPPVYPGPGASANGNNGPVRDVERGDTQRDEDDKEEHWISGNAAADKGFSKCNGNTFIDKQTLPILLKRPRRTLSGMSLKENMDTKRRSARIAAMHVSDGYKV